MNRTIHTIVEKEIYDKLLRYGNGILKDGIKKIIEIAESKQHDTKHKLKNIAFEILTNHVNEKYSYNDEYKIQD